MGIEHGRRNTLKTVAGVAAAVMVMALALYALGRVLAEVDPAQVAESFGRTSTWRVAIAAALTGLCYFALSGYDRIALRSIGRALPWQRTVLGSVAAYALSHNLGFAPITASYARLRVYQRDGLGVADVARVVVLTGASFWLGVVLVMGMCLVLVPGVLQSGSWTMSRPMQIAIGLVVIDVVIVYLLMISRGLRVLGSGRWTIPLPSLGDAVVQSGISLLEMALASAVLWILIPGSAAADYPLVLVAYVSAFVMVLISHSPGGAGVLEAVVILMLPELPKAEVLSALILFRIVFHLVPLVAALAIIAAHRPRPA